MREARLRIAAEFTPTDLAGVLAQATSGALDLTDLITHHAPALEAASAYSVAFTDPDCLKLCIDWRSSQEPRLSAASA
jgi:3-hydroxyethyl bacteriochlorophyllide a dehydrogenase